MYLLHHRLHSAYKIGIAKPQTSSPSDRISYHRRRYGWDCYRTLRLPAGKLAHRIEQDVLRVWRHDMHLPPYLSAEQADGHTETVSHDIGSAPQVWQTILNTYNRIIRDCIDEGTDHGTHDGTGDGRGQPF